MDQEEKFIEQKFGRKNPFKVPEGYFDDFASQIMKQLPEEKPASARVVQMAPRPRRRWRGLVAAAASVVVLALSWTVYTAVDHKQQPAHPAAATAQATDHSDYSTMDAMADYTMLDNEDIYAYVAEN
jgi:hypothetical protein